MKTSVANFIFWPKLSLQVCESLGQKIKFRKFPLPKKQKKKIIILYNFNNFGSPAMHLFCWARAACWPAPLFWCCPCLSTPWPQSAACSTCCPTCPSPSSTLHCSPKPSPANCTTPSTPKKRWGSSEMSYKTLVHLFSNNMTKLISKITKKSLDKCMERIKLQVKTYRR